MKPLFSIIMPTYNRGYIIWKTIQSVQKQIYPNWELLIVDDGSTDDTEKVIAQFQKDPRIHYLKIKHSHPATARNFGMKKAQGSFITYVDSDDYLYENYLSTALEFFEKFPEKMFAVCNYNRRVELYDEVHRLVDFANSSSSQKETITLQDFFHWNIKTCGTGTFHRKRINKSIMWDNKIRSFSDWDFIMQLGNYYPKEFMHIPYVLFEYLQQYGGDGICSNMTYQQWADDFSYVYKKHKGDQLLKGQTWYPERVEKYKKLQKDYEAGKVNDPVYKYFPNYKKKQ